MKTPSNIEVLPCVRRERHSDWVAPTLHSAPYKKPADVIHFRHRLEKDPSKVCTRCERVGHRASQCSRYNADDVS
jgi:hypothetical protein